MRALMRGLTQLTPRAPQSDIFEWHFVIRGPRDTEFEVRTKAMHNSALQGKAPWRARWVCSSAAVAGAGLYVLAPATVSTGTCTGAVRACHPANPLPFPLPQGGIYHGRILLPAEYPFKPPSFMMLTPNGRFETNMKICLSISSHHPEHWQPSWSVRTALMALIAFMPSPGNGALGAIVSARQPFDLSACGDPQPGLKWGGCPVLQRVVARTSPHW